MLARFATQPTRGASGNARKTWLLSPFTVAPLMPCVAAHRTKMACDNGATWNSASVCPDITTGGEEVDIDVRGAGGTVTCLLTLAVTNALNETGTATESGLQVIGEGGGGVAAHVGGRKGASILRRCNQARLLTHNSCPGALWSVQRRATPAARCTAGVHAGSTDRRRRRACREHVHSLELHGRRGRGAQCHWHRLHQRGVHLPVVSERCVAGAASGAWCLADMRRDA